MPLRTMSDMQQSGGPGTMRRLTDVVKKGRTNNVVHPQVQQPPRLAPAPADPRSQVCVYARSVHADVMLPKYLMRSPPSEDSINGPVPNNAR